MKNIVVLFPTATESSFFDRSDVVTVICGVGMARCGSVAARVAAEYNPDLMILAGIAGSYSEQVPVGDTVVVASEIVADMGRLSEGKFTPLYERVHGGAFIPDGYRAVVGATVDCAGFPHGMEGPEIENMEGAAFFAVCSELGIPFAEVRTVSNRVGELFGADEAAEAARILAAELDAVISNILG